MSSQLFAGEEHVGEEQRGDEKDQVGNIFEYLSQDDILEISITTNLDKIINNKFLEDWTKGVLKIKGVSDEHRVKNIKLKTRGKFRLRTCDFPPIKIKFNKADFEDEELDAHETLKLVTHCTDLEESEDLILKEFLAYKIYNIISNQSLRVQLAKITWIDSAGKNEIGEKWGFVIENDKQMAKRLEGKVEEATAVLQSDLNLSSAAQASFYQYMIGNPDWCLAPRQNMTIVKPKDEGGFLTVPYDFDFSGLVDAPYSVSSLGIYSVKERIYLGESEPKEIENVKVLFKSKKNEIVSMVKSFGHIKKSSRRAILKYIRSFYSSMNEPLKGRAFYEDRKEKRK